MKKLFKKLKERKGVTLIESVVAIAIFSIISLLVYQSLSTSMSNIGNANSRDRGVSNAETALAKHDTSKTSTAAGTFDIYKGTTKVDTVTGTYYTYTDKDGNEYTTFVPATN